MPEQKSEDSLCIFLLSTLKRVRFGQIASFLSHLLLLLPSKSPLFVSLRLIVCLFSVIDFGIRSSFTFTVPRSPWENFLIHPFLIHNKQDGRLGYAIFFVLKSFSYLFVFCLFVFYDGNYNVVAAVHRRNCNMKSVYEGCVYMNELGLSNCQCCCFLGRTCMWV